MPLSRSRVSQGNSGPSVGEFRAVTLNRATAKRRDGQTPRPPNPATAKERDGQKALTTQHKGRPVDRRTALPDSTAPFAVCKAPCVVCRCALSALRQSRVLAVALFVVRSILYSVFCGPQLERACRPMISPAWIRKTLVRCGVRSCSVSAPGSIVRNTAMASSNSFCSCGPRDGSGK